MRTVFQDDKYGCGAACAAMFAGISYPRARQVIFDGKKPSSSGIRKGKLLEVLAELGFVSGQKGRLGKIELRDLKGDALIMGSLLEGKKKYKHWMVWDHQAQVVRDPCGYRLPFRITSYTLIRQSKK